MQDFEKLGVFYLGREYDLSARRSKEDLLLYDSKDLVTHALCVGMTGSGKTGLCVGLLEEAAIDGIPAIIIDPKGDLPNLLLAFQNLTPAEFRPWVNEDEARRQDISPDEFAAKQADLWKNGLAKWGQDAARIARLRESAEFRVYTPGSSAGLPVSIVKSFARPDEAVMGDDELFRERVGTTVTSLLGLVGVDADPIQSREHILLSNILTAAWQQGGDVDLASLVSLIQQPPVQRIGVMDVDSFFPEKDRFALSMKLNNLLAAPGFAAWMQGESLDIQSLLYSPDGKPRHAIFSIAHLSDSERMFFVSLLLNQILGWTRGQSGTSSLRSIVYMDEIFGYFPPVANPPSKQPLLTLLKQARAFGVGVVLATQNPVDLDYKGLANCGTWFIGRLQTERDKQRVIDGLESAAAGDGGGVNRGDMESMIANLGNRVFLMRNVHEDRPMVFETRWALSYLRGPMTRQQIKTLMDPLRGAKALPSEPTKTTPSRTEITPRASTTAKPVLAPGIEQIFLPLASTVEEEQILYRPALFGIARMYFASKKDGIAAEKKLSILLPLDESASVNFDAGEELDLDEMSVARQPAGNAAYEPLPAQAGKPKSYDVWKKSFVDWLAREKPLELFSNPSFKLVSKPLESEGQFRARLQQAAREARDEFVEKLRLRYAGKFSVLNDRIRRADQAVQRERAQAQTSTIGSVLSVGTSILGAFLGRKSSMSSKAGKAATAARQVGRTMEQRGDVDRAERDVAAARSELERVESQFQSEVAAQSEEVDRQLADVKTIALNAKKTDIEVRLFSLAWAPYAKRDGNWTPAW